MNEILCINEDFAKWQSDKRYDVILMNPPFVKLGSKFIMKCADILKDGGYLGVVMSPTWRSITTNHLNKAYYQLLQQGGFHLIHMYDDINTKNLFGRSIGQVDTFVWQKGATTNNTKIINQRGDEFYVDLAKYPQAPPVLPSFQYDKYFDQVDGLKWYRFGHTRDKAYGPANHKFIDITTGKEFLCNDANIEKTRGKKVIIDQSLKQYHIDDIGDIVVNDRYMFFFDTNEERDKIAKALEFVIDNGYRDLFVNNVGRRKHSFIPGIKR